MRGEKFEFEPENNEEPQLDTPAMDAIKSFTEKLRQQEITKQEGRKAKRSKADNGKVELEKTPKISVDFFFSAHSTAEDFKGLEKRVEECDVFIPEAYGSGLGTQEVLQSVSNGESNPENLNGYENMDENLKAMLRMIHGTQKIITLADVFSEDKEYKELNELSQKINADRKISRQSFMDGEMDMALVAIKSAASESNQEAILRDECIRENINSILEIMEEDVASGNFPNQKKGEPIKILVQLGMAHVTIFDEIKKKNPDMKINRHLPEGISGFSATEEIERRMRYGKKIDEELFHQAILNNFLNRYFRPESKDTAKFIWAMGLTARKFSSEDVKQLSATMKDYSSEDDKIRAAEKFFGQKGVKIPKNDEDMDKILKLYKGK